MSSNKSILLKTIRLFNFGTYKAQEIRFHAGVTVITGPNGVGKSLLLDAIRLAFGLHARSVRMDKIENYIKRGADKAYIEIILSNPEFNGGYYLKSNNPEFNQLFLSNEVVEIRRTIARKGGSFFSIKKESGWVRLDSTKRQALQEVYLHIGLTPTDELNFITGEDYSNIIKENPHKRFEILSTKLGLNRIQVDYEEVRQRLDHNQNKKIELESNLKIAEETSKALEEKFKQFREMEENEKNRSEYENELLWVPIKRRRNKIEQMEKGKRNLKAEISETTVNITNEQKKIEELKTEIDIINKDYNKSKTKLDNIKGEMAGIKAVITQKRDDFNTIRNKIKYSEEIIAKKKLEKSNVEKEIKLLEEGETKGVSKEIVSRKKELEEEIKKITNEIIDKEQEYQKRTGIVLEKIIRSEEQIKLDIKEKHVEKSDIRKELFQKGKHAQHYDKSVRDFFQLISSNALSEEIYGPVSAVCKIIPKFEDWRAAIETGLGRFNSYFITDSKKAYKELIKNRKSNPSFSRIPLGFVEKGKGQTINVPANEIIYNSILNTIDGPKAVKAFLSDNAGKTLLIHDHEDLNIDGLMEAKGRFFLSKSLIQYRTGLRTLRSDSASPIRRYKGAPIGTPLDRAVKIDEHPQILALEKEIYELEQKLKTLRTKKDNVRDQPEIRELDKEIKKLRDEKLSKSNQLSIAEESISKEDSSLQLKVFNNKKDSVISFIRSRENQISNWKSEINENELQITNLKKKIEPLNNELGKYERASNNKSKIQRDMEKHLTRNETNLNRYTQTSEKVKADLDNAEQRILEEKDKLKEEEEEIGRKKIKKPSTIRPEAELNGRVAELTRNINKKRASGISSADEEKFLQHKEFINSLRNDIGKSLKEYEKLLTELMNWRGKWENAFDESIKKVESSFDEILQAIGALGRIEIANRDSPKLAQAFFWTKFGNEEEREIQHHSSGQQQAALVALIIALQSQSSSPITAIDEFDKGLDATVKAGLVDIIPKLVSKAVSLREEFQAFPIEQQFFVILPDVDPDLVTHDVNFYSIFKTNISSKIQEI